PLPRHRPHPPRSTPFPYTTLFRSRGTKRRRALSAPGDTGAPLHVENAARAANAIGARGAQAPERRRARAWPLTREARLQPDRRRPRRGTGGSSSGRSIDDLGAAFGFHSGEEVLHLFEALRGVALPFGDLADDSQRRARAVGLGRVAGEFLVGQVRVVEELAGRLDDVDALPPLALRELAAPDRGV